MQEKPCNDFINSKSVFTYIIMSSLENGSQASSKSETDFEYVIFGIEKATKMKI